MESRPDARLHGRRVALLVDDGFDAADVREPLRSLRAEGADVVLVGAAARAEYHDKMGASTVTADLAAGAARMKDFDALIIPGGHAPDKMRMRHAMVDLAATAMAAAKLVAAIGHGPTVLISANVLRGRTLTCWPSIAVDVTNAGGLYVDRPVVRDGNLVTSRKPDDLPAFTDAIVDALGDTQT